MGKFLDHLLLSGLQIAHVDFTWPGYGSTSLIAVFGLSFYNISCTGFTALFSTSSKGFEPSKNDSSLGQKMREP
jgi:hypothetical protein